ncbi:MAG: DUF4315 family protein [Butyrivibrio sp.]|nr:DUF4315 family protein [Butyrivibrio sp.]
MFANLDRLRSERDKLQLRLMELQEKVNTAEERVKEAEASQILDMVGILKMSPEELAQLIHKEKGMPITDFAKGAVVKKTEIKAKSTVAVPDRTDNSMVKDYEKINGGIDTDEN